MSKQTEPEDKTKSYFARDIPPDVEERVDAMMDISQGNKSEKVPLDKEELVASQAKVVPVSSAPLLPTDKLPDLGAPADKPDVSISPEPVVVSSEPMEPEIAAKPVDFDHDAVGLEDPDTGRAVDEIARAEADKVLEIEDEKKAEMPAAVKKPSSKRSFRAFIKSWWGNPKARWATIVAVLIVLVAAAAIPSSRYFVLNGVGVRSSTSMKVLDNKTGQPLKNVEVSMSGQSAKTDKEGYVRLADIKLGSQTLLIKKPAFADISEKLVIGWGSNPLGDFKLTAVGVQYSFELKDFLSGQPLQKAEAVSGESSARANEKGEIVLVVPESKDTETEIKIVSENYRTETLKLPVGTKELQKLNMVPERKHIFVSKRAGTYDLYKTDVDGKNEEKVLAGTGTEREDGLAVITHPSKEIAALVSTRENKRNKDGFLLSTLTVIDLNTNEKTAIAKSERIQIVDFVGDHLVFVRITEGASEASTTRHKLVSYNVDTLEEKELASTNYFNDVMVADGAVYYSPAVYQVNGAVGMYRIKPDGSDKKVIYDKEVWNLFRISHDKINAAMGQDWYEYTISSGQFTKLAGAPANTQSRLYADSPDNTRSAWTEERDGKGVLLIYGKKANEDKILHTQGGLKNPIRWLDNDHIVYRIAGSNETADYIISLSGGEPKKIVDVTNTAGLDRWYYY